MKKVILCIALAMLVACYKDEAIQTENAQSPLTKSRQYRGGDQYAKMKRHKITPERAVLLAREAKILFTDQHERRIRTLSVDSVLDPVMGFGRLQGSVFRNYYADYYFDEYGKFTGEKKYSGRSTQEYIHADMGWGIGKLVWVKRGSYEFDETNYDNELYYLAEFARKTKYYTDEVRIFEKIQ